MKYLALIIAAFTSAEMQAFQLAPRLVVNITIDQLRTDYMEAFAPLYSDGGFRRLLHDGLVYDGASYPFSPIERSSAVATLSTGTTPYYNGIIASQWLDRETLQPISCVDDATYTASPQRLKTSTVSDELKISSDGMAWVYSFAPDRETAILSAGHAGDGAFWIDNSGQWKWSTYYGAYAPEWVRTYNANSRQALKNKRLANDNVVDLSLIALASSQMGKDDVSDLLYITLSAAKNDDTTVSKWQSEMEDVYLRLDKSLDKLITGIDKQIGLDKVLFVVTSTGYTQEYNTNLEKYRVPTGTFYINRTANLLNIYLGAIYGQGRYVDQCFGNQIYLNRKLIEQKRAPLSEVLERCQSFLIQNAGVADVYTTDRLLAGNFEIARMRNGFNPSASGDIIVEVTPGWKLLNENTHETYTSRAGVVPFPIIFMGKDVTPQRITTPVTVDQIAPTVAKAIRIRAPNACNSAPLF